MKIFEKFLFFYSIVAITIFFISFGILSPSPLNFISGILMFPIIFYFWIRLTNPQNLVAEHWSLRFIFSIVILSSLGIGIYYINLKGIGLLSQKQGENLEKVQDLTAEINKLKANQTTPLPTAKSATVSGIATLLLPSPTPISELKVNVKGEKAINVYKDANLNSKVIGEAIPGIDYPYTDFTGSWYKIYLNETTSGWVSASLVQEVQ